MISTHIQIEYAEKLSEKQKDAPWESEITNKVFGCIFSYTAYHAEQIAIINKYEK
ncbi:hypothetical protein [Yeosuana marina]|uniref:hypothetical protein n=1 Tax=Yeosuana marina TaxID=1565536 RepID=UPI001423EF19|nr:hypothetical protein [Yeosuana marina]